MRALCARFVHSFTPRNGTSPQSFASARGGGRLGDAGVSVLTSPLDSWTSKPSLPKALVPAQKNLEHILRKQYVDGYLVLFQL